MATRTIYWVNCNKVERDLDYDPNVLWVTYWDNKVYSLTTLEFRVLVSTGGFDVEVAVDNTQPIVTIDKIYKLHGGTKRAEEEPF